jgi:lipopolysaccharide export LptBFGC system permease protein LptF
MFANLGIAVLTVLSFYGVLQGFLVMAQNGVISPFMAGLIPTLGYLVVGGFMMYKKR